MISELNSITPQNVHRWLLLTFDDQLNNISLLLRWRINCTIVDTIRAAVDLWQNIVRVQFNHLEKTIYLENKKIFRFFNEFLDDHYCSNWRCLSMIFHFTLKSLSCIGTCKTRWLILYIVFMLLFTHWDITLSLTRLLSCYSIKLLWIVL